MAEDGENRRDARSIAMNVGDVSRVQRPISTSSGPRRNGLIRDASDTRFQKRSSAARAPSGPPSV